MKLQQRFEEQGAKQPSALQKMSIYHQFLDKSHRSISYHKVSYYTKVALFSLGLVVIMGTAFYSFVPQTDTPYQIAKINDAYTTLTERDGQFAQADTIGQIITAQGDIEIIHGTTHIETTTLGENDRVLLAKGAEMHFSVDTNVEARITGPAEFVLENRGTVDGVQQFVINLIAGDYLEIISVPNITSSASAKQKTVVVQAPDFTLEQVDTRGNLDVVISKNNMGKTEVANKGTEVVIKKIIEDKQTFVAVQANEKVSINGDVAFIAEDIDDLMQEVKDQQLAVSYQIDTSTTNEDSIDDFLITSTTVRKVVLDEETMHALRSAISSTFLSHDIAQIKEYYTAGNQSAFLIAYSNLLAKLQRAHILTSIPYTPLAADQATLPLAAGSARVLASTLEQKYYIEPSVIAILHTVATTLEQIATQSLGEAGETDLVNEATIAPVSIEEDTPTDEQPSYEDLLEGLQIE